MPPKVDRKQKQDALLLEVQAPGLTQREIAKMIGISTRLFMKVTRNNKLYGDVSRRPAKEEAEIQAHPGHVGRMTCFSS